MKEQNTTPPNATTKTKEKLEQSLEKHVFKTSEVSFRSKVYADFANDLNRKIVVSSPSLSLPYKSAT